MESFIAFDIETTGINPLSAKITEIGAIKIINGKVVEEFNELINPLINIPEQIVELTGITDDMVKDRPSINFILPKFLAFADSNLPLLGHNILFDYSFIKYNALMLGKAFERKGIDTLYIARKTLKHLRSRRLGCLCEHYDIKLEKAHRALYDCIATYQIFNRLKADYNISNKELFIPKPLRWKQKKDSPITHKQKNYLQGLLNRYDISLEKDLDYLTKSEASQKIDEINFKYSRRRA